MGVWPFGDGVLINKSIIGVVSWAAVRTNFIILLPGGSRHRGLALSQEWVVCSEPASSLPGGGAGLSWLAGQRREPGQLLQGQRACPR